MVRSSILIICIAACASEEDIGVSEVSSDISMVSFHREHVTGDVYHYELRLPIGNAPNAALQIHRFVREVAPFVPRRTAHAVMVLHGDFSTTLTNFAPTLGDPASPAPGLAPYLAAHNIDVWGLDRRWTLPTSDGDISDFGAMGIAQELDDLRAALALARGVRTVDGSGSGKLALLGFSHGAQVAYTYAAVEGGRPASKRHVGALVALDFYGDFAPEDGDLHAATCDASVAEYEFVAEGFTDSPNDFFITAGELAASAPNDPSPLLDGLTNRGAMLLLAGQTYQFAPFAPFYHLLSPILDGDTATAFRLTTDAAADAWFAGATPHESMLEAADLDALLCGDAPPIDAPLSNIHVPLFYLGAAGGVGSNGIHTTTQVSSTDVTAQVVQLFDDDQRQADVGHGDLLFATDAPHLVWQPIAAWLGSH